MYWKFTYNKGKKRLFFVFWVFFSAKYQNYCQRKEGKFVY